MEKAIQWFKDRWSEASTWDGVTILVVSGAVLLASPFVKYFAIAGAAFGAWRIFQKETAE
jgi:hypothetical protein